VYYGNGMVTELLQGGCCPPPTLRFQPPLPNFAPSPLASFPTPLPPCLAQTRAPLVPRGRRIRRRGRALSPGRSPPVGPAPRRLARLRLPQVVSRGVRPLAVCWCATATRTSAHSTTDQTTCSTTCRARAGHRCGAAVADRFWPGTQPRVPSAQGEPRGWGRWWKGGGQRGREWTKGRRNRAGDECCEMVPH
jgi:hypothetical protein